MEDHPERGTSECLPSLTRQLLNPEKVEKATLPVKLNDIISENESYLHLLAELAIPNVTIDVHERTEVTEMSGQIRAETTQILLLRILDALIPPKSLIILTEAQWFELTNSIEIFQDGFCFLELDTGSLPKN